ncbi:hypothetical protein MM213_16595 [Belliella sp. R4-6]|uniref:Outer membrane protein beta-barrel domain-containing protein n=1 Tax=Belliella alkalica TaxID=1730871 RepID=A0ABS9VFA9_9BACT|nr:hypothetical protein [Belliella alkalica]MCH7415122.1 hypothetical protein [Belliella alkalica]
MKKILLTFVFITISFFAKSQEASVEKSTNGVQIGVLGTWFHNESRLTNKLALRSEVGFDGGFGWGMFYDGIGYTFAPVFTLEPRLYYNLDKRQSKSKNIVGNSGNFLSLKTSFHPDWFLISNYDNSGIVSQLSIVPTWGIRRNLGNHFTYEAGIGIGYRHLFYKSYGYAENEGEVAVNLHLRVGYRF